MGNKRREEASGVVNRGACDVVRVLSHASRFTHYVLFSLSCFYLYMGSTPRCGFSLESTVAGAARPTCLYGFKVGQAVPAIVDEYSTSWCAADISLFLFLSLSLLFTACQDQSSQNGHQLIAAAIRKLLDKSYAGIDYLAYRDGLKEIETIATQQLQLTPHQLRPKTEEMLTYLRTAEEVLRWQAEHGDKHTVEATLVATWVERHPFLRAAIGAQTNNAFDVGTALILLWDKTNARLPSFQVKSKPL